MNQILSQKFDKKVKKKILNTFKAQFICSIILFLFLLFYSLFYFCNIRNKESLSSFFINNFNIGKLYSSNNPIQKSNDDSLVIGIIEIEKINIKYSILSYTNDNLLKISPCRFYGPLPNKIGNLCIAGHNYNNSSFFSKIHLLEINDSIKIYDNSNSFVLYYIYDKYETNENDISCTNQNTNEKKEITLITCNNFNNNRLVIKAKE